VGDILDIPLLAHVPTHYQHENWLIDPGFYWAKTDKANWSQLKKLAKPFPSLWNLGHHTYHGENDKIPLEEATQLGDSLRLIHVESVLLSVFAPSAAFGNNKRRVQAKFSFQGTPYSLWVTDPVYELHYLAGCDGLYQIGESLLTISLGEPFNGECYKLVAAIIQRALPILAEFLGRLHTQKARDLFALEPIASQEEPTEG
jgi:hypothetical protein